jgi:hypothetical protein
MWPQVMVATWIGLFVICVGVVGQSRAVQVEEQRPVIAWLLGPAIVFMCGSLLVLLSVALGWTHIQEMLIASR